MSASTVQVRVPSMLRAAVGGEKAVQAEGSSVRDVLEDLSRRYPSVGSSLFETDGRLRNFVNVYVNDEDIRYTGRLDTAVQEGDTVSILPAVAGGSR